MITLHDTHKIGRTHPHMIDGDLNVSMRYVRWPAKLILSLKMA